MISVDLPKIYQTIPSPFTCLLLNNHYYYCSLILICADHKYMGSWPSSRVQAISKDSDIAPLSNHQIPVTLQLGVEPQEPFLHLGCKFDGIVLVRSCVGKCCCELMCAIVMLHPEDNITIQGFFPPTFSQCSPSLG